jgi:hypothetical protein
LSPVRHEYHPGESIANIIIRIDFGARGNHQPRAPKAPGDSFIVRFEVVCFPAPYSYTGIFATRYYSTQYRIISSLFTCFLGTPPKRLYDVDMVDSRTIAVATGTLLGVAGLICSVTAVVNALSGLIQAARRFLKNAESLILDSRLAVLFKKSRHLPYRVFKEALSCLTNFLHTFLKSPQFHVS